MSGKNKDSKNQYQGSYQNGGSQSQGFNRYDAFMGGEASHQSRQSSSRYSGNQAPQRPASYQHQRPAQAQRSHQGQQARQAQNGVHSQYNGNQPQYNGQYSQPHYAQSQQTPQRVNSQENAQQHLRQHSSQQHSAQNSAQQPSSGQRRVQNGTQSIQRTSQQQEIQQTQLMVQADYPMEQSYGDEAIAHHNRSSRNDKKSKEKKTKTKSEFKKNGKPRMSTSKKIVLAVVIALIAVLVVGGGLALAFIMKINKSLSFDKKEMEELQAALSDVSKAEDPFWMLLMGTDDDSGATRADTIILAYVDPTNLEAALISIPRDTRVYIPGYGYQKINAAHAYGGPSLAVETVSQFAGVPISHYAELNFASFYNMVDALGGVEVDVPVYVTATDTEGVPLWNANGEVLPDLQPGLQTLDANGALVFCRSRYYSNGDYQRQANQRIFLKALANKVLNSDLKTIVSAATTIANAVSTDMSVDEIVEIAQMLRGMNMEDIYTYTVPSYSDMIDEISYVIADEAALNTLIQNILAGDYPAAQDSSIAGITGDTYANANSTEEAAEY